LLLVVIALMLMLTSALSSAYNVDGFWPALLGVSSSASSAAR
jgi:uncharacterized membrane protein YvlD (DUF360 family)